MNGSGEESAESHEDGLVQDRVDQQQSTEVPREEELTLTWFAFKESPTVFGVFDTFQDEQGRTAHLNGKIAAAPMQIAPTMLAVDSPDIRTTDILATKLP
ncbi:antibiotic biosynthesis monooxygenase [Streptacidiphilus sp. MAP12-16]|uniref:antibiotic biosynthesis monooxygenase n=1 Tax=Streptacidiphilus sp. MAP12-16 TaxID=3156300 RepID=UPI003512F476